MIISSITTASVAASVWSTAVKAITSIVAAYTAVNTFNSSIGAGAVADIRPGAGKFRECNIATDNGTSATFGTYDGTTFTSLQTLTATTITTIFGTPARTMTYKNGDASAHNLTLTGWDIS